MIRRPLGRSDIAIAPLMLGGNVFGWTADREASFAVLDRFVDAGLNAIDTADVYSSWAPGNVGGESETVIGEWLSQRGGRDRVVIATKVGSAPTPANGPWLLSADHIVRSVEGSLARLRTDYIDLYQAHGDDTNTPLDETLEALDRLIRTGKVRAVGASHFTPDRLANAHEVSRERSLVRFDTMQPRYSLVARSEFEGDLQTLCVREQIGVLCYGVLAKGFLTGKYRSQADIDGKVYADFLRPNMNERGHGIVRALEMVADVHRTTVAAVAIAWVVAQPGVTAAIAAVDTTQQLDELVGAVELSLAPAEINALDGASRVASPAGVP
ncbi:aldo/keto reductase [Sphingomonas oligophenolica]|uniref:Aldo/keto reductase n=1 Tax=Sphingomonas oligophenolica TaxID=301154 RepID=A0ABU9YB57_9SPHN